MSDGQIQRPASDYAEIFAGSLPTGPAWPRDVDSVLMQVVDGLMQTWGRVDARFDDLLRIESDPRYTLEMLADWESAFGLPDLCLTSVQTIPDRRKAVVNKIAAQGGQSRAFFISSAAALGYTITIYEYLPVVCGISRCGETRSNGTITTTYARCGVVRCGVDRLQNTTIGGSGDWIWRLGPPELRFYWKVYVLGTRVTWFRCGTGIAGQDHLAEIAYAVDLECMIRRCAPAESEVIFDYSAVTASQPGSLDFRIPGNVNISVI